MREEIDYHIEQSTDSDDDSCGEEDEMEVERNLERNDYRYNNLRHFPALFRYHTGIDLQLFESVLFPSLQDFLNDRVGIFGPKHKLDPQSVLVMFLVWLRSGIPPQQFCGFFLIDHNTARRIIWEIVPTALQIWKRHVKWIPLRLQESHLSEYLNVGFRKVVATVDATEIPVRRPIDRDKQAVFYSGKSKQHSVKGQILIQPSTGLIMHASAVYPGSIHDLTVFRMTGVADIIRHGEKVLGDSGYQGMQHVVGALLPIKKPRNSSLSHDQKKFNFELSSRRVLVENVFSRLKKWMVMSHKWNGHLDDLNRLSKVFRICCCLVNITLQQGHID